MFDIIIETIRAVFTGGIVLFLYSKKSELSAYPGWNYISAGFILLFLANILDITDNVDALNRYVIIGDTPTQAILEKIFGYLASSLLLLIGFVKLVPFLHELQVTKRSLQESLAEVEKGMEEKRELHLRLLHAQKMESVGRLSGGIAHDFNNILSVVNGYSELLLMNLEDNSPIKNKIEAINQGGQKAAGLTRQLLAFSRKQVLEVKPIRMNVVINDLVKLLQKTLGEDISIEIHLNAFNDIIDADQTQIEQVLMNLAVNARDAMPNGGSLIFETKNMTLDEEAALTHPDMQPGSYVVIHVTDCGQGMDRETCERIFDPFFTTKEIHKGTGLGLSTSHGIIRQHNGQIFVYSELGKGTTFKIYLPVSSSKRTSKIVTKETDVRLHGNETILVVDDEAPIRKLIVTSLEQFGYRCVDASSGEEALKLMETSSQSPDVLLTDVIMPDMSGKELADAFLEEHPSTKTIFMSGYTENAIVHHGVLDDDVNFIPKPITPKILVQKVRDVLDSEKPQL